MKSASAIAFIAALAACNVAFGQLADEALSEHQELLSWAKTLHYQARGEQAMAVCEMVLDSDPDCVEALIRHGMLALSLDRFETAQEDFSRVLSLDDSHPMALVGLAHAQYALGDTVSAAIGAARAVQHCDGIINAGADDADTWYVRGLARIILKNEGAPADFAQALELDPTHVEARGERAHLQRASGRLQSAIDELTRAVEFRPDYAVGYLSRSVAHYDVGNIEAALADCSEALAINPQFGKAWHNRGLLQMERLDFEAAVRDLTQAIAARPEEASSYLYRGQANLARGNADAARADWEKTRELDPDGWVGDTAEEMLTRLGPAEIGEDSDT
ncbi:MAG: tetratricopeptide repeat protein [Armatimonadia bacterium]|nr:tetratricopeptide repeat protein [Armatimonadia bacterium]